MFKKVKKCRVCSSTNLRQIINLGDQPPANSLMPKILNQKKIPLSLLFCNNCKLIQLSATVKPESLFSKYLWVTGTSDKVKDYRDDFFKKANNYMTGKKVFEIASNDGFFLDAFKKKKYNVLGIDPAKNIAKQANKKKIKTIPKFFNFKNSKKIEKKYGKQDLIICRNVIPHVENINSVVKGISNLMHSKSISLIEFHYAKLLYTKNHYDYIYHEHIFYYTLRSIMYLLNKHKLYGFDCFESPISGGSIVLVISKKKRNISRVLKNKINIEKKLKINTLKFWKNFEKKCSMHKKKLLKIVNKFSIENKKIAGYGASARSSTIINYCKLNNLTIKEIFDKNILKNNLYTAGSNIKIKLPTKKRINNYDVILLLAWNFSEEIIKFLRNKVKYKGLIINILPKIIIKNASLKN